MSGIDTSGDAAPREPRYFYDISSRELLIGRQAVRRHIKAGADEQSIYPFADLLTNTDLPLPEPSELHDSKDWSRERIINQARFLAKVIRTEGPSRKPKEMVINEAVLGRARKLGQFPSLFALNEKWGSSIGFYQAAGLKETKRAKAFNDWEVENFIQYIKMVGYRESRRPTEELLISYHKKSPWTRPHPYLIAQRVGRGRGIGAAIELAGWLDIYNWDHDDYRAWGVKFMDANNGLEPTARMLNYLSQQKKGPSARAVMDNFGIARFKSEVGELYLSEQQQKDQERTERLSTIDQLVRIGYMPGQVVEGALSDSEKIIRYARYSVAKELLPDTIPDTLCRIAKPVKASGDNRGLISAIKEINPEVTAGDIENTALYRGFFGDLWPMDGYRKDLKLPDEMIWAGNSRVSLAVQA